MARDEDSPVNKGTTIWVGLGAAAIGAIALFANDAYKNTPRLEGAILVSSIGTVDYRSPIASYLLYVSLKNISEVPFVPVSYRLQVRHDAVWHEAFAVSQHAGDPSPSIFLRGKEPEKLGKAAGRWTICFQPQSFLLGPAHLNVAIERDKPISGLLIFRAQMTAMASNDDLMLEVKDAAGHTSTIRRDYTELRMLTDTQKGVVWTPGEGTCPVPTEV